MKSVKVGSKSFGKLVERPGLGKERVRKKVARILEDVKKDEGRQRLFIKLFLLKIKQYIIFILNR